MLQHYAVFCFPECFETENEIVETDCKTIDDTIREIRRKRGIFPECFYFIVKREDGTIVYSSKMHYINKIKRGMNDRIQ